ncbi:MAG: phage baseplate protein [Candidatus Saccharimonadales bacterium]
MDYDYLPVSDGTGDAPLMTITAVRLIGATTISIDTVARVPAKFIGTYGTLLPTNLIDPATKCDFRGRVSGTSLVIDGFEPGSVDAGNVEGQVVIIKPNSGWSDRVAQAVQSVHPVGSIYIETTGVNPGTTFGFGTWTAFGTGRVLVGLDAGQTEFDTIEETGGAKTHTLTTAEIPAHQHQQTAAGSSGGSGLGVDGTTPRTGQNGLYLNTSNTGGGGAHNNLQPYITVHMWKRTA